MVGRYSSAWSREGQFKNIGLGGMIVPTYIVTGSYSAQAAADMVENPRDRESIAKAIVDAAGGTLDAWYITTGPMDVLMIVTIDDIDSLMAGLIVGASSGNFTDLQSQRAFTNADFTRIQEKASTLMS